MLKKMFFITMFIFTFIATSSADQSNPVYVSMNKKQPSGDSNADGELTPTLNKDRKKFSLKEGTC